jgi:hypothetical protein
MGAVELELQGVELFVQDGDPVMSNKKNLSIFGAVGLYGNMIRISAVGSPDPEIDERNGAALIGIAYGAAQSALRRWREELDLRNPGVAA